MTTGGSTHWSGGQASRTLRLGTALALLAACLVIPAAAATAAPASPAPRPPAGADASAAAASAQAQRSGRRVEITSARTEFTQVFANPAGGFTSESAVEPQRVRRTNGSWSAVDLNLRRAGDGTWRPAASVADVRFAGGGSNNRGATVTLVRHGKSLTLTWPAALPEPSVSGDAATYAEVLPGTDLVLRATRTGFTHVFIVKTPAAAANPALRELRFALAGDASVTRAPGGGLRARIGDDVIATAEPAVMWDSRTTPAGASAARGAARPDADGGTSSSAALPGDTARTAAVGVAVAGGDLVLRPDPGLLAPRTATFPVFIDPAWSTGKRTWAYATINNSNNTDVSVARVGRDPDSGKVYRSYFDFPLTAIRGKHVESAYVQMKLDHSWSCDSTPVYMHHSAGIASTPRTKWAPALHTLRASASGHANEGAGCSDSPQPDMTMNFTGTLVTGLINTYAARSATNVTFGFCTCSDKTGSGESITERWKKFFPQNAKLVVDYDSIPGKPNNLQAAGVACPPGPTLTIGTLQPTFSAIFPDADRTQALTTGYEWVRVPANGVVTDTTPRLSPPRGASVPAGGRSTTAALTGLVDGGTYAFRARATDPPPYGRVSVWSDWCKFRVDTSVPYVSAHITRTTKGTGEDRAALPGGVISITIWSGDLTVTRLRYGWASPPTREVAATQGTVRLPGFGDFVTAKHAVVALTVPRYGLNTLYVSAVDGAGNIGYGSFEFVAERPSPAVARWGLETYPGVTAADALADGQPALAGDTPLSGNLDWADGSRLAGGATAAFNGISTAGATAGPVVDTTASFSVATWVRLPALPAGDRIAVAQQGTDAAGFQLGVRMEGSPATPRWSFAMRDADLRSAAIRTASSATPLTAVDVGRWTHLAGTYDSATGVVRLSVNGTPVAETTGPAAPWNAAGRFIVGRGWHAGAPASWWQGGVADVQAFQRALVNHDFTGQLADDPDSGGFDEPGILSAVRVGDWDFTGAISCRQETEPSACTAPEAGRFGRRLALTRGTDVGDGRRGTFLRTDGEPIDVPGEPTLEYGRSQDNAGTAEQPQWRDGRVLRTDDSFSVSAWVRPEALLGGNRTAVSQVGNVQSAFMLGQRSFQVNGAAELRWSFTLYERDDANGGGRTIDVAMRARTLDDEDVSRWTHLVGVYDRSRRQVRLYVDGQLETVGAIGGADFPQTFDATGPLVVAGARWAPDRDLPRWANPWHGDIDDIGLFQGALTDAAVLALFESQSAETVEPVE